MFSPKREQNVPLFSTLSHIVSIQYSYNPSILPDYLRPFLPFIPTSKPPLNHLPPPSYLQTYHPRQQNPILNAVAILFYFAYNKIFCKVVMS